MNKKLFYEQPQIGVLHLNTEGPMIAIVSGNQQDEIDDDWQE